MTFQSVMLVLPTGSWPGGSKSSVELAPYKPLDRLDVTAYPQHNMDWLYCRVSVIFNQQFLCFELS
jgi:hypothetical protein